MKITITNAEKETLSLSLGVSFPVGMQFNRKNVLYRLWRSGTTCTKCEREILGLIPGVSFPVGMQLNHKNVLYRLWRSGTTCTKCDCEIISFHVDIQNEQSRIGEAANNSAIIDYHFPRVC